MRTIIYGLADPRDGQLRYVGKTVWTLERRLGRHLSASSRGKNRKDRWIARLIAKDLRPEIFEIEVVDGSWVEAERFWIAYFRSIGADLMNHTSGGEGEPGFRVAEDVKRRISIGNKGKPKSAEHVAKILAGPGIFRKGQVAHNKGKSWSEETRKRIGDVQRGKPKGPPSQAHRDAIGRANLGKNKGKPWSPSRRAAYEARFS